VNVPKDGEVLAHADHDSLPKTIGRIAALLDSTDFPNGQRAALRRNTPGRPPNLDFYRFAFMNLPSEWVHNRDAWMTIVAGIAIMHPQAHRPDRPMGRALAESGYSESRLERLLAAEGEVLCQLVMRAARFLAAKNESANWIDFASLMLTTHDAEKRERARMRIASDFYRQQKKEG
jgi:CRISPR system Cascade subunit CasB